MGDRVIMQIMGILIRMPGEPSESFPIVDIYPPRGAHSVIDNSSELLSWFPFPSALNISWNSYSSFWSSQASI